MKDFFIINRENQIEHIDRAEYARGFIDTTTTPLGVGPRMHVREENWYRVEDTFFETSVEANDCADDARDNDPRLEVKKITRFEGWTWGHQGNFPRRLFVFDTRDEANQWLQERAELDFDRACNAPMVFSTREAAELFIAENTATE